MNLIVVTSNSFLTLDPKGWHHKAKQGESQTRYYPMVTTLTDVACDRLLGHMSHSQATRTAQFGL